MPTVNIKKDFTFQHPDGYMEFIPVGNYEMDDDMANNVYVRAHSDNPPEPRFRAGTPVHAAAMAQFEASRNLQTQQESSVGNQAAEEARGEYRRNAAQDVQQQRPNQRQRQGEQTQRARIDTDAAGRHEDMRPAVDMQGQEPQGEGQQAPQGEGQQPQGQPQRAQIDPGTGDQPQGQQIQEQQG